MKKLFISHSNFDKDVSDILVNFLVAGIGVFPDSIFCSSEDGNDIPIGVNFNDYVLKQLENTEGFIAIAVVSNTYYNSKYCLYELGTIWGLSNGEAIFPLLVKGMKNGSLQDFISHNEAIDVTKKENIDKLSNSIRLNKDICKTLVSTETYEKEREELLSRFKKMNLARQKNNHEAFDKIRYNKYKLVAFDFDGTILQGNNYKHSWKEIWNSLNYEESIRIGLAEKHKKDSKNYSFQDWCDECVKYFADRNFHKRDIAKIINDRELKIADSFDTVVTVLSKLGIKIIIISGGIDSFIYSTINENTLQLIDKVFINKFIYDKHGYLLSGVAYQNNNSDSVGKTKVLENYCIKNNIQLDEVVFVGDETNDIDVMQSVGKAIVYPGETASSFNKDIKDFVTVHERNMVNILPEII
ncbi:HAD-IB family phosphatase [Ferruginibacter sp. SUN106]|uniref:HAD-IB family phosphatase n=1 Tax=Ferruginibacter sp. SUN106 TaxID=2978348 RepID=UPI003D35E0F5